MIVNDPTGTQSVNVMIFYFLKRRSQIGALLKTHCLYHPPVLLPRSEKHN